MIHSILASALLTYIRPGHVAVSESIVEFRMKWRKAYHSNLQQVQWALPRSTPYLKMNFVCLPLIATPTWSYGFTMTSTDLQSRWSANTHTPRIPFLLSHNVMNVALTTDTYAIMLLRSTSREGCGYEFLCTRTNHSHTSHVRRKRHSS